MSGSENIEDTLQEEEDAAAIDEEAALESIINVEDTLQEEQSDGTAINNLGGSSTEVLLVSGSAGKTSKRWSILKVPGHVREVHEKAYSPKIVSIGPIHRNNPSLVAFEAHKTRFLDRLLKKMSKSRPNLDLKDAMTRLEDKTRKCYSECFDDMRGNEFAQMMMLDGCFIVELLHLYDRFSKRQDVKEPIFGTRWMLPVMGRDLLMLENQLPMFVLQKIYKETSVCDQETHLNELALHFFDNLRPSMDKLVQVRGGNYPHLLALFQASFVASPRNSLSTIRGKKIKLDRFPGKGWVNNAKRLTSAGVKLKKKSGRLLDIEFRKGVLKIPTIFLDDGSCPLLRNLLAFEQSNRFAAPYFTRLAVFLDSIVDTTEDINILREAGIIKQTKGGNDEVVDLLNSLTKHLEFEPKDYYLAKQIEEINDFCQTRMAKFRATLDSALSKMNFPSIILSYISLALTMYFFY